MSLPASAATYFHGGSSGFFVPVLAKMISCRSGVGRVDQNSWFACQIRFAPTMPTCPCAAGDKFGHVLLRVHVHARNEDAVNALEAIERLAPLRAAPDGIAGRLVLPHREDQRHVERHAGGAQFFERIRARPASPAP